MLTLLSRILGMFESRVLAHYLGAGPAADSFFVAFRLPNLLRRFTAEGVMVAAFLPTVHEVESREGEEASRVFVARFLGSLLTLLGVACFLGVTTMVGIVALMELGRLAPGQGPAGLAAAALEVLRGRRAIPTEWTLTVLLGRTMFPYVLLVSVSAALGGILNLRGRFALPAATPALWNAVVITFGCLLVLALGWGSPEKAAVAFAVAVLLGGLSQVLLLWPSYRGLGYGITPGLHLDDAAVLRTLRRMAPGILGAGAYQINVLVSTLLASSLPSGAQTVLFNSTMMGEMVLGLFAVSLATVSLPLMTRQAEGGDVPGLLQSLSLGLRSTEVAAVPAAVGLALLARPILALIFQTGKFTEEAVSWTATTLVYQAAGIPFIAASRILVPALYALKDYRGPVLIGIVSVAANIVLSIGLMGPLGTGGIALANGLASALGLVLLGRLVRQRLGVLPTREVASSWGRIALASIPMGLMAWKGSELLGLQHFSGVLSTSLRLFPLIGLCVGAYFGLLLALGSREASELVTRLRRPTTSP